MKKRYLVFIISIFISGFIFNPYAQDIKVYSVSGQVEKKLGNSWEGLKKLSRLEPKDIVKIKPESMLRVMDVSKHEVYTFQSTGEYQISNLIENIKKENSSITQKILAESRKNISESNSKSHKTIGAALRGEADEEEIEAIYSEIINTLSGKSGKGLIIFEKRPLEDDLFYFTISNQSKDPVFINIFRREKDLWRPILEGEGVSGIKINESETLPLEHLVYMEDPSVSYLGVAYEDEFPAEEIQYRLNEHLEPMDGIIQEKDISVVIIK